MSPAHPGGHSTSACHCLPAGRLHFLCPEPALAFFLMTLGRQLDCRSRNNTHLQVGRVGAPTAPQGSCTLGGTLKSDAYPVVFQLGFSEPWGSVEVPQGPLRMGSGEHGRGKGYAKQAGFSSHSHHPLEQFHFYLVYILHLHIKVKK